MLTEIAAEFIEDNRLHDAQYVATDIETATIWNDQSLKPSRRLAIVTMEHAAGNFFVSTDANQVYDRRAALTDPHSPLPGYNLSLGAMERDIIRPLSEIIPFRPTDFMAATAVRHAAVTMALPVPEGYNQINIHHLGRVA
jgi:hypothetical protein